MLLVILIILTTITYYLIKLNYQYWEKRKVPGPKPSFLVGNLGKVFTLRMSAGDTYTKIYNDYPDEEMVGIYRGTSPVLLLRDPELIKEVTTKSFSSFHDNDVDILKENDPIFGRNPFALKGEEWKVVRGQLTPGFTSGKMKWLFPLMEEVCTELVKFIDQHPDTTNGQGFEAKELSMMYTLNNVASCAFGLQGKCFEKENSTFRQLAREFFSTDSWSVLWFFIMMVYPPISRILSMRFVSKPLEEKLMRLVCDTLKYREQNNIVRNDFLHIMAQLKKTCKEYDFTNEDVTAHAAGFFGDGYETSSIVMSFTLFELAANPECQSRLREELEASFENDKISYEALTSLAYLEAAICEGLRLHPALFFLQKRCTKDFSYKHLVIEKGTAVILPVYGLHTDGKYYEEPAVFKPERFLPGSRENLTKYTFLPFGEGPRACLGQKFGMLQVKAGIAYIIRNYEILVNGKTQLPLKYSITNAMTAPVGGLWLDFKKIK
ncbi:hypothetical protein Zmor_027766 [Zophobas morio]|uniref:Cytochrome P450 n=1 Tax=Zophobas morio TaxID=2755281 RepID=A0AA38HRB5_9CUCU|nr:hypothetical protein Zmor_027766 [Zophobas morio]